MRTLLQQQLYNLSDEQMKFQFLDRLSFLRFARLRHGSQVPDRTTLWTFRERAGHSGRSGNAVRRCTPEFDKKSHKCL